MPQRYSSTERIPSEVVALAPDPKFIPESGMEMVGSALLKLSADLQDAKDAETIAKSTASYNAQMIAAELQLENLDPRDDNVDYVAHMKAAGQKAMAEAYKIKSKRARERVINNITVNNQRYEANAGYNSIKKVGSLIRMELPDKRQMYIGMGPAGKAEFGEYLKGVEDFLTPAEIEHEIIAYKNDEADYLRKAEYDNAIGEIKANPVEGLKNARANPYLTNGQKNALDNIFINQKKINENIVEFEKELLLQQSAEIVSKTIDNEMPALNNPMEAQATITTMIESDDKDIRKQGQRAQKMLNVSLKPPSEMAETDPFEFLDLQKNIAEYLSKSKTVESTAAVKKTAEDTRFINEKMSQKDYLKASSFMGIEVPPESRANLGAIINNNIERFKQPIPGFGAGRGKAIPGLGIVPSPVQHTAQSAISAVDINNSFLEWVASATPEELKTPGKMEEINEQIVRSVKNNEDPGEQIAGVKLQRMIDAGKVSGTTLEFIKIAKANNVPAWKILEADEIRLAGMPVADIKDGVETYSFGSKDDAKDAAKKLRAVARDNGERIRIAIKNNAVVVTKLED